jgi:hypothetical protein
VEEAELGEEEEGCGFGEVGAEFNEGELSVLVLDGESVLGDEGTRLSISI